MGRNSHSFIFIPGADRFPKSLQMLFESTFQLILINGIKLLDMFLSSFILSMIPLQQTSLLANTELTKPG